MRTFLTTILFFFTSVLYSQVETRYFDKPADLEEISGGHIQELPIVKAITNIPESEVQKKILQCKQSDTPSTERYGYPIDVSYTLSDGSWNDIAGGRMWAMTFFSDDASSLNFAFSNMSLPKGAEIYVVSKDNRVVFGPITCDVINKSGFYLTDLISGDESTIYLYEPFEYSGKSTFSIEKIIHGVSQDNIYTEEENNRVVIVPWNTHVACSPDWVDSAKGVAGIISSDGTICGNGTLMMSTDLSFRPYILLSYDIIDTNGNDSLSASEISTAENWAFRFNKRKADCSGNSNVSSQLFNGATLRSSWYNSGFALMELDNEITSSQIRWQGWDRSSNTPSQGVCIYSGFGNDSNSDYLSISSENHSLYSKKCSIRNLYHWVIGLWDDGCSYGGKYGAPLFNQDYRVVGHLNHRDFDLVNMSSEICFGKLPSSWTGGGTNTTGLSNWLDPVGTGQTIINSSQRVIIDGPDIVCGTSLYNLRYLESSYNVTWSFKNASYLNSLISYTPSDPTFCSVTIDGNTTLDNILVATLWRNGMTVGTVEKHIMTAKQLTGTITQTGGHVPGGYTYPSFTHSIESVSAVNQMCLITIQSPKLRHMEVSPYTNPQANINIQRIDDETISFAIPGSTGNIGIHLYFTGISACNNFDLRLIALRDPIDPSLPLYIGMDGNLVEIGVIDESANECLRQEETKKELLSDNQPQSWTLEVFEATTGRKIVSTIVKSRNVSLDTSGWNPGVYIVCGQIKGKSYSKKITVK